MSQVAFQLRASGYEISLEGDKIALDFFGDGDPDVGVVKPLIEQVKMSKTALMQYLKQEEMEAASISQATGCARDWQDLSATCDTIDTVFNLGQLTPEQADRLIKEVVVRSRAIPEVAATRGSE